MSTVRELREQLKSSAELHLRGWDATQLARQCRSGALHRIRHGAYVARADWDKLDRWDKYRLQVLAVNMSAMRAPLFSHESAAIINAAPVLGVPLQVHTQQEGRRSARSRKDIRRHFVDGYIPDKVRVDGLRLTSLEHTLVALATESGFASAVVAFDSLLRGNRTDAGLILKAADWIKADAGRRRLASVMDFSDASAESPGESASRAYMALFGLQQPRLQAEFRDARGFVARSDFYWPQRKLIGEFDGIVKYQKPEYMNGRTASQVVVEEKKREDRLRALGFKVVRWVWKDVNEPQRLRNLLLSEGLTAGNPLAWAMPNQASAPDSRRSA